MILCEALDILVSGVMTKDHAFVTVHIGEMDYDVETTNPHGFDPGTRKEFNDEWGRATGFAYVPPQNYRERMKISKTELISLIMNNRIAELERGNRFAQAVPIAIDRAALLLGSELAGNKDAYPTDGLFKNPYIDILDRVFNYGSTLLKANKEEDALLWAAAASPLYPAPERWQEFTSAAVNNRFVRFTKARQTTEARIFLETHKALITEAEYAQHDIVLIDTELLSSAQKIRTAEEGYASVDSISEALANGKINENRAKELLTFSVQKTAQILSAAPARNWRAAVNYIESSIERLGSNRDLEQSLQSYRQNLATDYHNRFADAWNKKNFDEAVRILNEGLAEFPNDRQLLKNKETVEK
jgi:hypothetical protein